MVGSTTVNTNTPERMLSSNETLELVGIRSVNTLKRLIRDEGFPEPYRLMKGRNSFSDCEVRSWLHQRMADQRGVAA